jgi:hypothetical protein
MLNESHQWEIFQLLNEHGRIFKMKFEHLLCISLSNTWKPEIYIDIHNEINVIYYDGNISHSMAKKLRKRFLKGRIDLYDDPRSAMPMNSIELNQFNQLLVEQPFISCRTIFNILNLSKSINLLFFMKILSFENFIEN